MTFLAGFHPSAPVPPSIFVIFKSVDVLHFEENQQAQMRETSAQQTRAESALVQLTSDTSRRTEAFPETGAGTDSEK